MMRTSAPRRDSSRAAVSPAGPASEMRTGPVLLMALLRPSIPVLVGLIAATAWACYAFLRVNYAILSMAITMYVVLLFAFAGLPEPLVALHRAVATLLGGVIALSTHLLGIWVMRLWQRNDRSTRGENLR